MKLRKWKMWAVMPKDDEGTHAFDVYFHRGAAMCVKAPYEKVVPVSVRELPKARRKG